MIGISGLNPYYAYSGRNAYGAYGAYGLSSAARAGKVNGQSSLYGAKRTAMPEAPVDRVRPVTSVKADAPSLIDQTLPSWNLNASEEAVRMRIQYAGNQPQQEGAQAALPWQTSGQTVQTAQAALPWQNTAAENPLNMAEEAWSGLPNYPGMDAAETAVRMRIEYPGSEKAAEAEEAEAKVPDSDEPVGAEGVQKTVEDGKCETCEQRKYQDGSDDMSVSFQTPTRIAPENVASAVRGHEMEHVSHEQAKAAQEGRKVVSQSVTLHTDICPECGKTYISGGTTRTVTAAKNEQPTAEQSKQEDPKDAKTPAGIA